MLRESILSYSLSMSWDVLNLYITLVGTQDSARGLLSRRFVLTGSGRSQRPLKYNTSTLIALVMSSVWPSHSCKADSNCIPMEVVM